jgi:hypothetical protein
MRRKSSDAFNALISIKPGSPGFFFAASLYCFIALLQFPDLRIIPT